MFKRVISKYNNLSIQIKASLWFLVCSFLQKGISTITTPIFTRLLTTTEYGQYNVFNSWLGIITVFISMRMYFGVYTQGLIKFDHERNIFSSSLQGLSLTMSVAWLIVYIVFHSFWNNLFKLTTVQMLAMMLMIWTTSVFNFWAAEQRVDYKYKTLVFVTILVSLAKPIIGIIFVLLAEDKVTARILGITLVEVVGYIWFFFIQMRNGKIFYSKKYWKYALLFSIPLIPHYLSQTILTSSDRIMIKNLIGPSEAGIYSLAYSVSQIMTLFNQALSQTLQPWALKKIKAQKTDAIPKVAYSALLFIAAVNLVLIIMAPEVVGLFAPSAYYEAIWVIPPVAMSSLFGFMYYLFSYFEFYFEKKRYITISTMLSAAANIVLNYFFIKYFGYKAAAYTTLICYILYAMTHYFFTIKICDKYLDGKRVYSAKILTGISVLFICGGFMFMFMYNLPEIRYTFVILILLIVIIFRKKIGAVINQFVDINRSK